MTDAEVRAFIEKRRGRPLTLAEQNIDIATLNRELNEGKADLTAAIERAKMKAINEWIARGLLGPIHVAITPEIAKLLGRLYDAGRRHGEEELAKAGYREFAQRPTKRQKIDALKRQFTALLGGMNFRVNEEAAVQLELGTVTTNAIVDALSKIPGALDVAGRMTSPTVYAGLGAVFDVASDNVDADEAGGGGNGWEYTAVMDDGTCDVCAAADGTTYDTWEQAQDDLPDGGPNPDCFGGSRCRCRLAPVPL